jgi:hypothetical protein
MAGAAQQCWPRCAGRGISGGGLFPGGRRWVHCWLRRQAGSRHRRRCRDVGGLWVILGVRAIRARSWRDGIHTLVVRNRWWTYRVPLASIQEVRIGIIGFGANPAGLIVRATDNGRNPWHRIRGLPIDGTASYSADRKNADMAAVRHMIADARRRANN